jgi:hypothetical protein
MDINLLFDKHELSYTYFANAYAKIKVGFEQTNKLKKVSYSLYRKRFCFYGYIQNGILKVELKKISEQVHE